MSSFDSAVWPNDVIASDWELARESPSHLVCFLLSPFEPRERFDLVHEAVRAACKLCEQTAGITIDCRRADSLSEAKAVHNDIWQHIARADWLVIDITGLNPNVMIELGVAAALRRPTQVILIKDRDDESRLPFNTFAQRYLPYRRSILGDQDFLAGLRSAMIQAITPAPYSPPVALNGVSNGFKVDFQQGDRPDLILSPSITHRRCISGCLEYGSFYIFRNSWLLLGTREQRNVRVRVLFRFGERLQAGAYLGLSLRNQHYYANWGHMVFLRADGKVVRTEPEDEVGRYRDVDVGQIPSFDPSAPNLIEFVVTFTEERMSFRVGTVEDEIAVGDMPYVYGAGKVRLSTSLCRVHIREIELQPL